LALLEVSREAQAIEAEAFRGVVAMAEFGDAGTEFAQAAPMFGAVRRLERADEAGVMGGEQNGQQVGKRAALLRQKHFGGQAHRR
jgi:hypothetical protein